MRRSFTIDYSFFFVTTLPLGKAAWVPSTTPWNYLEFQMPKSQMALKMASWCLRTTWEQPLRLRWTKRSRCSTQGKVGSSASPEHLTSWWKFTAGMTPASSGLGALKTAWPLVHRRVSGLSALRSRISCKTSRRRWNERSPCCRNGKRELKRNLKKNAWGICV